MCCSPDHAKPVVPFKNILAIVMRTQLHHQSRHYMMCAFSVPGNFGLGNNKIAPKRFRNVFVVIWLIVEFHTTLLWEIGFHIFAEGRWIEFNPGLESTVLVTTFLYISVSKLLKDWRALGHQTTTTRLAGWKGPISSTLSKEGSLHLCSLDLDFRNFFLIVW